MSIEIELRYPTVAYGYANVKVTGNTGAEVKAKLADAAGASGLAIQLAGGGDSTAQAERLLREELGAVRINEDGSPWDQPSAPVNQPWGETSQTPTNDPFASPGGDPFGAAPSPAPAATDPFAAPARDYFFIEVPRDKIDAWKELRTQLQNNLGKGVIGWDGEAKRNTIKKSTAQNVLDGLKQRGYDLR